MYLEVYMYAGLLLREGPAELEGTWKRKDGQVLAYNV